jgi:hypothetical protein
MPDYHQPGSTYTGRQYKIVDTDDKVHFVNAGSRSDAEKWAREQNIVIKSITLHTSGSSIFKIWK